MITSHRVGAGQDHDSELAPHTLFIRPKTVSAHVSNILRKLNLTSRVQAAAVAHRTGLVDR